MEIKNFWYYFGVIIIVLGSFCSLICGISKDWNFAFVFGGILASIFVGGIMILVAKIENNTRITNTPTETIIRQTTNNNITPTETITRIPIQPSHIEALETETNIYIKKQQSDFFELNNVGVILIVIACCLILILLPTLL